MKFKMKLSPEKAAKMATTVLVNTKKTQLIWLFIVLIILVLPRFFIRIYSSLFSIILQSTATILLFMTVTVLYSYLSIKKKNSQTPISEGKIYTVDNNGITEKRNDSEIFLPWSDFSGYVLTDEGIYLYIGERAVLFDRTQLDDGGLQLIDKFNEQNINKMKWLLA